MGGNTRSRTNSGASLTVGSPGTSASTTPVSTRRIAGGIFNRFATIPTTETMASSSIKLWMVRVIATFARWSVARAGHAVRDQAGSVEWNLLDKGTDGT